MDGIKDNNCDVCRECRARKVFFPKPNIVFDDILRLNVWPGDIVDTTDTDAATCSTMVVNFNLDAEIMDWRQFFTRVS